MDYERLTILVDLDDTIDDLLTAWVCALNEKFGTNVDPQQVKQWDVSEYFPELSKADIYSVHNWNNPWANVRPKPGAVEYIKRLIDDGHRVFVVTSTHYINLQMKMEEVLFKYFPYLRWEQVIITQDKAMIDGDVIIDAGVQNHLRKRRLNIVIDTPHNRHVNDASLGLKRVGGIEEAYRAVSELANQCLIQEVSNGRN